MTPFTWMKLPSFPGRRQQEVSTGTETYIGRSRLQQVDAMEESADQCSRKCW